MQSNTSPRNYKEAVEFDRANGNTLWQDATKKEMDLIKEFETFKSLGKGTRIPKGHHRIYVHLIYDCKVDMRRRAQQSHLTPKENKFIGL